MLRPSCVVGLYEIWVDDCSNIGIASHEVTQFLCLYCSPFYGVIMLVITSHYRGTTILFKGRKPFTLMKLLILDRLLRDMLLLLWIWSSIISFVYEIMTHFDFTGYAVIVMNMIKYYFLCLRNNDSFWFYRFGISMIGQIFH